MGFTNELDAYTNFDKFFDDLDRRLRKSAEAIPGTLWLTKDVRCKFGPGGSTQTWTHIFDKSSGKLDVVASEPIDGWPILEMRLHKEPLILEMWFREVGESKPSTTGYLPMKGIQTDIIDKIFPLDGQADDEEQLQRSRKSWLPPCETCGSRNDGRAPCIVIDPHRLT